MTRRLFAMILGGLLAAGPAAADTVSVAVAANFTAAMKEIARAFAAETGHTVEPSFGSTGKLYAQIIKGAPYQAFLAADVARPEKLETEGHAVAGSRFTYALGKLVLWSASEDMVPADGAALLAQGNYARLAIANPKTAPYGAAAVDVLKNLGIYDRVADRLVRGDSITQTWQFVASKAAAVGFIALAQIALDDRGSRWLVPQDLYPPIAQQAVLIQDDPTARAFLDFLKSDIAVDIIHRYGYGTE